MEAFAMKLPKIGAFSFGVCTCGEEAGMAMKQFSKHYPLDSSYSLVMPNNYIVGTDTDDEATIHAKINAARKELQKISGEISQRKKVYRVEEGSLAGLKSSLVNFGFNRFARSTKSFYATSLCNACGLCAKNCPAHTLRWSITFQAGEPGAISACDASTNVQSRPSSTAKVPKADAATPSRITCLRTNNSSKW